MQVEFDEDEPIVYEGITVHYWSLCEYEQFFDNPGGLIPLEGSDPTRWANQTDTFIRDKITFDVVLHRPTTPAAAPDRLKRNAARDQTAEAPAIASVWDAPVVHVGVGTATSTLSLGVGHVLLLTVGLVLIVSNVRLQRKLAVRRMQDQRGQLGVHRLASRSFVALVAIVAFVAPVSTVAQSVDAVCGAAGDGATCVCIPALYTMFCDSGTAVSVPTVGTATQFMSATNNKITHVSTGSLEHAQSLLSLTLKHNPITMVERGAFDAATALETLELDHTLLHNLPDNALAHVVGLKKFTASHTLLGLVWLHKNELAHMQSLVHVDFSAAHVHTLTARQFATTVRLRVANFSHNPLHSVAPDAFASMLGMDSTVYLSRAIDMRGSPTECSIDAGAVTQVVLVYMRVECVAGGRNGNNSRSIAGNVHVVAMCILYNY